MKKTLALFITVVMVLTMSLTAFAAPGAFVSSPSANQGPTLVSGTNSNPDCGGKVTVTSYADRNTLDAEARKHIEDSYKDIVGTNDLSKLINGLDDIAKKNNASAKDFAVSDLFDISFAGCSDHDGHGNFDMKLSADTLKNFVALARRNGDKWEIVPGARVEGDHLIFSTDVEGAFAIIVNTADVPKTGDDSNPWLFVVLMAVAAAGLVVVGFCLRKKES